jgi:UDP-N-acetylglucosamine:LPS N-acetylglucosamine transferase
MILLVSSSGGVLRDLLAMEQWWSSHAGTSWVAVAAPDTREALAGKAVRWEPELDTHRPLDLLPATWRALKHLAADAPDVVVSAGTGIAVPYFLAAQLTKTPTFWVETFNIVGHSGVAARLCMRLASRVLVQRPDLIKTRHRAAFIGELY